MSGGRLRPNADKPGVTGVQPDEPSAQTQADGIGGSKSTFAFPTAKPSKAAGASVPEKRPRDPGYMHAGGEVTPEYELVQSGQTDMQEAWSDKGLDSVPTCPKALVIRVHLPGVPSVSGAIQTITLPAAVSSCCRHPRSPVAACARAVHIKHAQTMTLACWHACIVRVCLTAYLASKYVSLSALD